MKAALSILGQSLSASRSRSLLRRSALAVTLALVAADASAEPGGAADGGGGGAPPPPPALKAADELVLGTCEMVVDIGTVIIVSWVSIVRFEKEGNGQERKKNGAHSICSKK